MGTSTRSMALFSASESVYLSSFLSSVDLDSSINNDGSIDPGLAEQIPHLQGSEALAKATKDLMALDVPVASARPHSAGQPSHPHHHPTASSPPSYWPSLPPGEQPSSSSGPPGNPHALAQSMRTSPPAHFLQRAQSSTIAPADSLRSGERAGGSLFTSHPGQQPSQQHVQIAPLRGFDPQPPPSGFSLPPISTSGFPGGLGASEGSRPSAGPSAASSPSVLTATSTKRPLPASCEPATDPSSSKRPRPSPASSSFPAAPEADSAPASASASTPHTRPRHNSSAAARRSTPSVQQQQQSAPAGEGKEKERTKEREKSTGGGGGGGGGGGSSKGALLSPSQKRANHIQSEQKRRANIRRGYEALCEVVPALREAIRAEEERERAGQTHGGAGDDEGGGGKGKGRAGADKGKKKRKGEGERPDGRAGPRSENVVLQKTIDYISDLLAERSLLAERLQIARGILPLGHPAAQLDPRHVDAQGVPLWEREWNGGMDLDIGVGDEGSEDEG